MIIKKRFYEMIWMFGARLESLGGRLAQWGYFHYFPEHPSNPRRALTAAAAGQTAASEPGPGDQA